MAGSSSCTTRSSVARRRRPRSEEHTSELQSQSNLVCRLLLEKKKDIKLKTAVWGSTFFYAMAIYETANSTILELDLSDVDLSDPYSGCDGTSCLHLREYSAVV